MYPHVYTLLVDTSNVCCLIFLMVGQDLSMISTTEDFPRTNGDFHSYALNQKICIYIYNTLYIKCIYSVYIYNIYIYIRIYIYIYIYLQMYKYVYVYMYTYIHTYVHTYIHTYLHTYIHTYITLHYITLHYITLHYITLHYISLHYITLHFITLHYITYTYLPYTLQLTWTNFAFRIGAATHPPCPVPWCHSDRSGDSQGSRLLGVTMVRTTVELGQKP